MFLDTNFNSVGRVMSNIYQNFVEAGMKYYRYAKSLRSDQQPHTSVLIGMLAQSPRVFGAKGDDLQEPSET